MNSNLDLPDVREVRPLSSEDQACLAEIRDVLARHGRLTRFGVCLLHRHFAAEEDEVLSETCDEAARTLTSRVVKRATLDGVRTLQTQWRLDRFGSLQDCMQTCSYDEDNNHTGSDHL